MKIENGNTDAAVLAELGERLARTRLELNMDQRELAIEAGVSKITVKMTSFIRILRALELLGNLDRLVPEPLPSPLERLKTSGRRRRRATGRRGGGAQPRENEPAGGWIWADSGENGEMG